jgi:SAM-dependent methyltransferase
MRFDAAEHLAAWQRTRTYPAIHRPICDMVMNFARSERFLDLCCSYGLIGHYLAERGGMTAVGVDRDGAVLDRARAAGVAIPHYPLRITRETTDQVMQLVDQHQLTGIIARRALPELFDRDLDFGREFFMQARAHGIRELFLEGRVVSPAAVSALPSIEAEIELVEPWFVLFRRVRSLAHLVAQQPA